MMDNIWHDMVSAAQSVRKPRKISNYMEAGGVSAAVLSASGKIYTGVCIDTDCTLGICAERNAIFNMITNGEYEIKRVVCIMNDKNVGGSPCGACREFMIQLMPDNYKQIEILLDGKSERVISLGELAPEWWI